jgi:pimeloyl-ACP methyl ester carboxylesterase
MIDAPRTIAPMGPRVQYATASDGTQIAFSVTGSGPPLLWLFPIIASNFQATLQSPIHRELFELLTRQWTLVTLDARGFGLSDEDVADMSLAAQLSDIEAVLDRLAIDQFVCAATELSVPPAVALAARHPGRVRRLVLINPFVRFSQYMSTPGWFAVAEVARNDRGMFLEAWATNTAGFASLPKEL